MPHPQILRFTYCIYLSSYLWYPPGFTHFLPTESTFDQKRVPFILPILKYPSDYFYLSSCLCYPPGFTHSLSPERKPVTVDCAASPVTILDTSVDSTGTGRGESAGFKVQRGVAAK